MYTGGRQKGLEDASQQACSAERHTMLLYPLRELLRCSIPQNRQQLIMKSKLQQQQLPVPEPCPSPHPPAEPTPCHQPEAANRQRGQRGHADTHSVTHMKAHGHAQQLIRLDAGKPSATLPEVSEVTQLLSSQMLMTEGCDDADD